MKVTIDIPDAMQQSLQDQLGQNLAQAAKEAMAVAWYQAESLSIGQVAEFLGISVYEAEGFMKARGISAPFSLEDYEHDRETLDRLVKP
jgi:predicted HTH domain antitoxin